MATNGEFYTDSNGREMLKRTRDYRETWTIDLQEKIAGNYYPINSKIAIEDSTHRLAVINDRSQGGSSIFDGTLELMVHRRLLRDDGFGVGEALNETAYGQGIVARGKHYMVYGRKSDQSPTLEARERLLQNRVLLSNWLFFDDISTRANDVLSENFIKQHSLIGEALPEHVYLMTYEPWRANSFLIRFEHILEKNEDPQLSLPVSFNLTRVFPGDFEFTELTLAANQWLDTKADRLKFTQDVKADQQMETQRAQTQRALDNVMITLRPMEMRTFIMAPPTSPDVATTSRVDATTATNVVPTTNLGVKAHTFLMLLPFISMITIFCKFLYN